MIALKSPRPRALASRLVPLVAAVSACLLAISATAQTANLAIATPPASTTGSGPVPTPPPSQRDADYAALARDVQSMDREFSIVKRVVKLVTPTVVHIESKPLPKFQGLLHVEEAGSGVIVQFNSKNYILTNRHVIRHSSPEKIEIHLFDGRVIHPTQIWSDSETDVALLGVDADNLAPARFGDSDKLEIGDYVLAVGSPFGLSQSVTRGIVSAKGRHNLDLGDDELKWQNFIQTDAAINPGNSGGPLVNLRGEVVGLNTAIASASGGNEGIGFSIPINIASRIGHALADNHQIPRGFLGVKLDINFNQARAKQLGLDALVGTRVSKVEPKSPAERANLQVDDVILEYNGVRIDQDIHLISLVKLTEIGRRVPITVFRNGKVISVDVEIADSSGYKESEN
ncbi:MAG TPA: trypsin-like peptidase domain-containing protein [Lacipirellulaceae bacterium]|nr:trypsin-like peptidase domain-containing protein [Lacipirellulaceae bacterium]